MRIGALVGRDLATQPLLDPSDMGIIGLLLEVVHLLHLELAGHGAGLLAALVELRLPWRLLTRMRRLRRLACVRRGDVAVHLLVLLFANVFLVGFLLE